MLPMKPVLTIRTTSLTSSHCRGDTMSSLDSILTDYSSWGTDDTPFFDEREGPPPAPLLPCLDQSQSSLHILSCSSPEIRNLCKKHSRDDSGMMSCISLIAISPCGTMEDLFAEEDLEGLSESLSKIEFFTPTPERSVVCSPDLKKPCRGHRRVSYDVLPSMKEIEQEDDILLGSLSKPSPLSSRHRRNTTQMIPSLWS